MVYLSYALYPIVIGYAIYALKYETHKSWYSWILNSLVGAVYTFGFILMCPQVIPLGFTKPLLAHCCIRISFSEAREGCMGCHPAVLHKWCRTN